MTGRDLGPPYRDPRWNPRPLDGIGSRAEDCHHELQGVRGLIPRPRHAPWPTTVLWRWRWELGLLAGAALLVWGSWLTTGAWVLVTAPVVVSALALIRPCQIALAHRYSAIVVQHRIRLGCARAALYGTEGQLPAVLWTRVTPIGERIHLWSSPTVTLEDFRAERQKLAEACGAQSVRVARHPRFAQVVILDVVRRGPREPVIEAAVMRRIPRQRQKLGV